MSQQLLLYSPCFAPKKIKLVPATNNWISPGCLLILHFSSRDVAHHKANRTSLESLVTFGRQIKRLTQSQLECFWLRNTQSASSSIEPARPCLPLFTPDVWVRTQICPASSEQRKQMHDNCAFFRGQLDWKKIYDGSKIIVLKMRVFEKHWEKPILWPIVSRLSCRYCSHAEGSAGWVPLRQEKRGRTREASRFHAAANKGCSWSMFVRWESEQWPQWPRELWHFNWR